MYSFVICTYCCIVFYSLFQLVHEQRFCSARMVFYFFALFFFGIAPLVQFLTDGILAPLYSNLQDEDFAKTNLIIIFIFILFNFLYGLFYQSKNEKKYAGEHNEFVAVPSATEKRLVPNHGILLILMIFSVLWVMWLNNFNWNNILFRGGDGEIDRMNIGQTYSLLLRGIRYFPAAAFYFYYISRPRSPYMLTFLFASTLFCAFPLALARLQLGPVYLPLFFLCIPFFRRYKNLLILAGGGFMTFIFPFLSFLRRSVVETNLASYDFEIFSKFNTLDFDSYKTLVFVVANNVCTYGRQLLGVWFFWVPRVIWSDKPVGSGCYIATEYDLGFGSFSNIAMNFFGEGYINFGYAGIVLFVFVLAWACAKWDRLFWLENRASLSHHFAVYYFAMIGIFPFVLRGDLLSGTAFSVAVMVSYFVVEKLAFKAEK